MARQSGAVEMAISKEETTMTTQNNRFSRRTFIQSAGLSVAAPYVITSTALGAPAAPPASERVTVGKIGCGGRGSGLGGVGCQVVAACDPWKDRRDRWAAKAKCPAYVDFRDVLARDDIDAVCIATTDHWHVPIAVAAAQAGKDMYCEKPLGLTVREDQVCRDAIRRYGRMFQYGTQQRSSAHCRRGCELVRSGYIGEVQEIKVLVPDGRPGGSVAPAAVPETLDYDLWLGPARWRPYCNQSHYGDGNGWAFTYDYCLGYIAGCGAHPLDILQWGYDSHLAGPWEVEGIGWIPTEGRSDTVMRYNVDFRFANGVKLNVKAGEARWAGNNCTTFIGTEGSISIAREFIKSDPPSLLTIELKQDDVHLTKSHNHGLNFAESVKSRRDPVSNIEDAVRSNFISTIADIAVRSGRKIVWDPATEQIVDDEQASRRVVRPCREPWCL